MSQQITNNAVTYINGNGTLLPHRRVIDAGGTLRYASDAELENGTVTRTITPNIPASVQLLDTGGPWTMIAADAISKDAPVYRAASGKVSAAGTSQIGIADSSSSVDGDFIEVRFQAVGTGGGGGGGSTTLFSSVATKAALLTQGVLEVGHVSRVTNSTFSYRLTALPTTSAANWELTTHVRRMTTAEFAAIATNYADLDDGMIVDDIDEGKRFRYDPTLNAPAIPNEGWEEIAGFGGGGAGGAGGATNLNHTPAPTGGTVTSDTGTDANIPLSNATNAGYRRPSGVVAVPSGTVIALSNSTSYEITTADDFETISGMDATWDGETIEVYVGAIASLRSTDNIVFDGSRGDIITPTFAAYVTLKYRHSDTTWYEISRSKF